MDGVMMRIVSRRFFRNEKHRERCYGQRQNSNQSKKNCGHDSTMPFFNLTDTA